MARLTYKTADMVAGLSIRLVRAASKLEDHGLVEEARHLRNAAHEVALVAVALDSQVKPLRRAAASPAEQSVLIRDTEKSSPPKPTGDSA